jgi:hypothetical protein
LLQQHLYLQNVALARHDFVKHRIYKESDKQTGQQAGHDLDGKWLLRVGAYARRECSGQKPEASLKGGHHGAQPKQRRLPGCGTDVLYSLAGAY